jgi:3-oxoacyl-[acyl-carrier protein] reductase
MNTTLIHKRALVTGGSCGIGSAICRQLAADGFDVIVHANRHLDAAQAVVETIQAAGGQAQALVFDITDAAATATTLEALLADGPIQVLVT